MRHGLLRPPMYGEPGGLEGEITIAQLLCRRGVRHPGRRQVAHGRERASRSRSTSASTTSTASSPSPTCTPSGATRTSSRRSSTARSAPAGSRTCRSTSASCTRRAAATPRTSRRSRSPSCRLLDDKWADYSLDFIRRMGAGRRRALVPVPLHPRRALRQLPARTVPRHRRPRSTRTRTRSSSSTTSSAASSRELEATGQLEDTLIFISSDNGPEMETWPDAAYSPFRSAKGSTWEGGQRVPGHHRVAGHDRGRPGERRAVLADGPVQHDARGSPAPKTASRATATSTASTRRRSCSTPSGESNRKYLYYWLGERVLGAARRRVEVHGGVDLGRRPRRA